MLLSAPLPLASNDQCGCQQTSEHNPDTGTNETLLNRVANKEDAAECERNTADPDHPACPKTFFKADLL